MTRSSKPHVDAVLAQTLGEHSSQRWPARVGRVRVHVRREQRRFSGAKRGRGRRKEGECLPERDDAMSLRPQRRGAHVQGIERRQLDVEHARRDAHIEKIPLGSCDTFRAMTIEAPALSSSRRAVSTIGGSIPAWRWPRRLIVFVGFAPTYFLRGSYQSTPLPTYLQRARLPVHDLDRALHRADVARRGATDRRAPPAGLGDGGAGGGDGHRRHDRRDRVDARPGRGRQRGRRRWRS